MFRNRFVKTGRVSSLCSYWDMAYDGDVMDNRVGLNLLYAQVRSFMTWVDSLFISGVNNPFLVGVPPGGAEPRRKSNYRRLCLFTSCICCVGLFAWFQHCVKNKSGISRLPNSFAPPPPPRPLLYLIAVSVCFDFATTSLIVLVADHRPADWNLERVKTNHRKLRSVCLCMFVCLCLIVRWPVLFTWKS